VKAERKKDELDEVDGKILELVKREGKAGLSSSKLYESLSKYGKDRSLRGRVDRLKKLGILITEDVQLKVGRSRVIRVKEQP
jgi:DNA-binding Lrp family transcriptional regulator